MMAEQNRATAGDWGVWILSLLDRWWRACACGDRAAAAAWQMQVEAARAARAASGKGQP